MIDVITYETAHLTGDALVQHHRLRHREFIDRQGWDVPTHNGLEFDQYDTPVAVYLTYRDVVGKVRGACRLLPTTRPYMIRDLWPEFVDGPLPSSADVWEVSRFCVDHRLANASRQAVSGELILAAQEYGLANGIDRYILLTPPAIIRLTIAGAGCDFEPLGQTGRVDHGARVIAAEIPVSEKIKERVRRVTGAPGSVLAFPINPAETEEEAA